MINLFTHEIGIQKQKMKFCFPNQDLNQGPLEPKACFPNQDLNQGPLEPKASVLPMSYTRGGQTTAWGQQTASEDILKHSLNFIEA